MELKLETENMRRTLAVAILAAAAIPAMAHAEIDYSYVQVGLIDYTVDGVNDPGGDNGVQVKFSVGLGEQFYVHGDFSSVEIASVLETRRFAVGLGFHTQGDHTFYAEGNIERLSLGVGLFDLGDEGIGVELGTRHLFGDKFELEVGAHYSDYGSVGYQSSLEVSGQFHINEQIALGGTLKFVEDETTLGLDLRVSWGG
jgi:hypothetical protein